MMIKDLENDIKTTDSIMLYFGGEHCGVCNVLKPKIKDTFDSNFSKIKQVFITASDNPKLSAHFGVFSVPTIIVYFEGKQFINKSRLISIDGLVQDLSRPYDLFFN